VGEPGGDLARTDLLIQQVVAKTEICGEIRR
jgi:hypothetical protein